MKKQIRTKENIIENPLFTKNDVIKDILLFREKIANDSKTDAVRSAAFYNTLEELIDKFYGEVKKYIFFSASKEWCYSWKVDYTGIKLFVNHVEGEEGNALICNQKTELIFLPCCMLSPEEYGKKFGVDSTTVRQWIRRGKIRAAKKVGEGWLIPELTDVPRRNYTSARYVWESLSYIPDGCGQYLESCCGIEISQSDKDKKVYIVKTLDENNEVQKAVPLDLKTKEKLELAVIAHPDIRYDKDIL